MTRKMYWGLAILILLIGTAAVFVIQHEMVENRELKDQLVELQALANQINQQKVSKNNPPPTEPGFKWVWHNDHWDKVPIDNPIGPIEHHDVPIDDVPGDSDTNYVEFSMSEEELARVREIDWEQLPKRIEFYKNAIPKAEERYNNLSIYIQKYPDADKWLREQLSEHKKTLDRYKQQLSYAEYRLALMERRNGGKQ